ncbi:aminotransferase [Salipiger sp. 1_MG-2023]|uniref:SIS domain-containing protein n=1 Tax=Salipiger sp. 1_MG-2023 TaxID=3062665 RepID=UPI0026E374DF|nr:aminotransferase [Salipiger sp. 1_MG-2023]MDO6587382.1 aminotransferase [Salipiger sp. 1_MG-2023]
MLKTPFAQIQPLYDEMARQMADSRASIDGNAGRAAQIAASIRETGRLVLLGMGGSHAVGRILEPSYRALGIDAVAVTLSEQLDAPLPLDGTTVIVTSQSGESAEVLRWFREGHAPRDAFGLTMQGCSTLAGLAPCLVGAGGAETPFAATRSLTVTLALHAAVLAELGVSLGDVYGAMQAQAPDVGAAVTHLGTARCLVTSGRTAQGVAEAIALGLTELSRLPCFSLEGGQLRHGPVEMLAPEVGVIFFRDADASARHVTSLAQFVLDKSSSPVVVFDASGAAPIDGALTVPCHPAQGLAGAFSLLPAAQRFMVDFAASRLPDAGTPMRCTKVTTVE